MASERGSTYGRRSALPPRSGKPHGPEPPQCLLRFIPRQGDNVIVYLEAMLHCLACIGSIHDAVGEIIVNGQTGFLVDQDDMTDLRRR